MAPSAPNAIERIERFAARPAALATMAIWAAAEAVALPVVPDVGLGLLVLAAPRQAARLFAAVPLGALGGTLILAFLAALAPDAVRAMLLALPGLDASQIVEATNQLQRDGILGFVQLGVGPPLKVYSNEWLALGGDVPGLVIGAILNRLTRIGPVLLVASGAGLILASAIRRNSGATLAAYATFWVAVYAILWT
jgi:membrane protein YqaA with SNARE-associated domain